MGYGWLSANLLDGRVNDRMPGVEPTGALELVLSGPSTTQVTLNLDDKTSPDWEANVREGGSLLAAYDDTADGEPLIWVGAVSEDPRDGAVDAVTITLLTLEGIFDWADVGDVTYPIGMARNDVMAAIVNNWFRTPTGMTYLQLDYVVGGGPKIADEALVFQNAENASVKDRLDQVVAQFGGQYFVDWAWSADRQSIIPTVHFGDSAKATGNPMVRFTMPGNVTALQQDRLYGKENGARKIVAYSSGQGDLTPYAAPVYGPPDGRPIFEFRWQPAPNLSPVALARYAQQAIPVVAPGMRPITITVSTARASETGHLFGRDWRIGDTVQITVESQYVNEQGAVVKVRAFPNGIDTTALVTAVSIDPQAQTITPHLADKAVYVQGGS